MQNLEIVMDEAPRLKYELNFEEQLKSDQKLKCEQFGNSVRNDNELTEHKVNFHGMEQERRQDKPYRCDVCNKGFVSRSNLRAHCRLHEGTALRYPCPHCRRRFSHPSEVKQHQVVHTGIRAYSCIRCGNKYSRYPSLWKHMKKCRLICRREVVLVKPLGQLEIQSMAGSHRDSQMEVLLKHVNDTENDNVGDKSVIVDVSDGTVVVDEIEVSEDIHSSILPVDNYSIDNPL